MKYGIIGKSQLISFECIISLVPDHWCIQELSIRILGKGEGEGGGNERWESLGTGWSLGFLRVLRPDFEIA